MQKPVVVIASDHGGFELKELAKQWLETWGYQVEDLGAHQENPRDDYPLFAIALGERVAELEKSEPAVGILFCRSGGGMVIAANKVPGIRAVALENVVAAEHAKLHNNANVASIAADWLSEDQAKTIIKTFLTTAFKGEERHVRRLAQITQFETEKSTV